MSFECVRAGSRAATQSASAEDDGLARPRRGTRRGRGRHRLVGPSATSANTGWPSSVVSCSFRAAEAASALRGNVTVARPVFEPVGSSSRGSGWDSLAVAEEDLRAMRGDFASRHVERQVVERDDLARRLARRRLRRPWRAALRPPRPCGGSSCTAPAPCSTSAARRSASRRWAPSFCGPAALGPLLGLALLALALLPVAPLGGQAPRLGGQAPRLGVLGVALRLGRRSFSALGPRLPLGLSARGLGLRDLGAALRRRPRPRPARIAARAACSSARRLFSASCAARRASRRSAVSLATIRSNADVDWRAAYVAASAAARAASRACLAIGTTLPAISARSRPRRVPPPGAAPCRPRSGTPRRARPH